MSEIDYKRAIRAAQRRNHGVVAGILACIFAVLGIFTLGILFVPIAAFCGVVGVLRGATAFNLSGFAISALGVVLSIVGMATSPTLLLALGLTLASNSKGSSIGESAPQISCGSGGCFPMRPDNPADQALAASANERRSREAARIEPRASQSEQDAPVTDCDTYTASDSDPQHKAKDVPYEKIDASLAITACKIASQRYPNSSRLFFQLGRAYDKGNDFKAALVQYRKAADQGHAVAKFNLGLLYAKGQGVAKDSAQAIAWYQMAANQGFVLAQKQLGAMYYLGEGVTQNYAEARKWYRMAADNGDAEAQNNIGAMFDQGLGVAKDYAEAVSWYRKASDQENSVAQHNLGAMYFDGKGVIQSFTDAMKWYRKAADQGNAKGQSSLGFMYYAGQGVAQNYNEAIKWFRSAADQGDTTAQKNLGGIYYLGEGVPRNYDQAIKWFRKAADQGDAYSQNILGSMYEDGQGVAKDYVEAANWYRKAADQGEAHATNNLALLYVRFPVLRGEGSNQTASVVQVASNDPPPLPETENLLVAAVEKARAAYAAGANEMAQGAARPARAKEICAAIRNPQISGWVGEVETLSSNSDGLGVLAVRIAKDVSIKTWNNSISDSSAKTLIGPDSAVFKKAVGLKKGQRIKFAGQFIRDDTDCFREGSLSLKGSLTQPEFIFRFSDVVAIE